MGDDIMLQVTEDETSLLLEKARAFEEDRPRLIENKKKIRKHICKCLEKNGFKKKGKQLFYIVKEDVVAFFCLEHPSNQMYIWFCVKPLFMPPLPYLSLSIGNRLSTILDKKMDIYDYVEIEDVVKRCEIITEFIQRHALPFIQSINSAEKVISLLRNPDQLVTAKRIVALSPKTQHEILMYAELSLYQYTEAEREAQCYLMHIDKPKSSENVRKTGRQDYQQVISLCNEKDNAKVDRIISEWRKENMAFFTGLMCE